MMKRYLLSIVLGILAFANFSYGQLEINFSDQTTNTGGTVDVDVTVNGFSDISVLQFSAGWDSLVMTFNSVVFTNPALPDLAPNNISGPAGAQNVDEGQFSFSYGSPTGDGNLDDGEILFTVRFDVVGDECDETDIEMTGDPTSIEAFDADFNELTVTSITGNVMINGTDCGGGGGDDLTITAETLTVLQGGNVCVSLNVLNFTGVQAGSGTILWDPAVISYTGIANIELAGVNGSLNETNTDNGELKFVWSNPDPANPLSIPDGGAIFDICFDAVGNVGDMSAVTLSTQGSLGFEWFDDNDDVIPQDLNNGKVTITEDVGDPFVLNISTASGDENESNVCVDISVQNFNNIIATQYVITWDASVLSNATPTNFNLASLNANSFSIEEGCATLSWSVGEGITIADGTVIYSLCFDIIGECDEESEVNFISKGSTEIEFIDGDTNPIDNYSINAGSVSVVCMAECEIVNIDRPCAGSLGGNVTVDVPTGNCTYSWADGSGAEVSTDKNLLGVGSGTYILTVSCDGSEVCTLTAVVDALPELSISGNVSDAGCGELGAIDVAVGGGSGNYSYSWDPTQDNSPNISGLQPGVYNVTVTDTDSNCTGTSSFEVQEDVSPLEISNSNVDDESCNGNDGSISLTVTGGCDPYTYTWSDSSIGNTPMATGLSEGNYTVTVTDNSSPAATVTGSFTIEGSTPIELNGVPVITGSDGSDNGSITIMVMGGVSPYNYSWSGPTSGLPNSNSISGLSPGNYSVTVTDANGCTAEFGSWEVTETTGPGEPDIENFGASNNANGFSVVCNGDATGIITGTIKGGDFPMTVALSGSESRSETINNIGSFSFDMLASGTYTIEVSNSVGSVSVENIEIVEPDAIEVGIDTGCDSESQCDGFIDLSVSGGFGDFSYDWNDSSLDGESLDDLCKGDYTVFITDENGCERMESIEVESCEGPIDPGCYEVREIITPNGDGINDQFAVTCIKDFPAILEIYDRWGRLVYNQDSYDGTWSGVSNSNEELIEGGYMYIININFGSGRREIMKGTITLLRD